MIAQKRHWLRHAAGSPEGKSSRIQVTNSRNSLLLVAFSLVVLIGSASWALQVKIGAEAREDIGQSLLTVRDATHYSVKTWFKEHKSAATIWGNAPQVREAAQQLLDVSPSQASLLESPAQRELRAWFHRLQKATRYQGYFLVGPDNINLASSRDQNVGVENLLTGQGGFLERIWSGETAVSLPTSSDVPLPDDDGHPRPGLPTMFAAAPVTNDSDETIAIFMFRLDPAEGFCSILRRGRIGQTGETYAFDRRGRLLSQSRYDDQLRAIGLIPVDRHAMLNMYLLDPGANLAEGEQSDIPRSQQPLTRMAISAIAGEAGIDPDGYRGYRGVPVVGAWLWDPDLGFGIATELDVDEAYRTLHDTTQTIVAMTILIILLLLGLATIYVLYQQRKEVEAALRERESLFRTLLEGVGTDQVIYRQAFDGAFQYVTPAIERFTGVPLSQALGRRWWELFRVDQDTLDRRNAYLTRLRNGEEIEPHEATYRHPDGTLRTVEVTERPEVDEHGRPIGVVGIIKDITERNKTEQELRRAATVFDNTDEGIIVTDAKRNVIVVNKAFTRITGYELDEVVGQNPLIQQSGRHDRTFYDQIWATVEHTDRWQGEIWNRRKDGDVYPAWENISAVKDEHGRVLNYVAVFSDISVIKESEDRLAHLAHHDPLTGLPNRMRFIANLEQALASAKRHKEKVGLMFLDLDRFKLVNDTMGHAFGDKLLTRVADRLKACVRAEDTVARLGGDEFTIILTEIARSENATLVAEKIIESLGQPIQLENQEVSTTAAVGISIYPDDADNADGMVKAADTAMYHAKGRGRGSFEFYRAELTLKAIDHLEIETSLRHALSNGELVVHYQPQVAASDGHMIGVEALIRWKHPERGLLLPAAFIDVADETWLIDPICDWVLRTACSDLDNWRSMGLRPVRMAVNVSARQVLNESSIQRIITTLDEITVEPNILELDLEITETSIELADSTVDVMSRLKERGIMLAIDDFGTGHSSLSRLKALPVDTLKIDRSFITDIAEDPDDKAIASAIIAMGHNLGLRIIGEGVETEEQLMVLRALGCDEIQGFYYSKPLPAERIAHLMEREPAHA